MTGNFKFTGTDIVIGATGAETEEGAKYVAQLVRVRLLTVLGEWDLDKSLGIPWYDILNTNFNLDIIRGFIRTSILQTRGVVSIAALNLSKNSDRTLTVEFTGISNGGEEFASSATI